MITTSFVFQLREYFSAISSRKLEFLRLALLGLITLLIFWPMLRGIDIGAVDAYVYHEIIADALEQYRHHIFPVYVGQSLFSFTGTPMDRAPYLLFLVGFLNLLTFGKLNSLEIQHATIIFSALAGVYLMYCALLKIAPKQRWLAFVFAIFYITCPAILAIIAKLDMYYSFIAIPFLPLLIYSLVRNYKKNDILSYVLLSASLSLIWMSHPSIAFFCTTVCAIFFSFRLISQPTIFAKLVFAGALFTLLSLWQFITIFNLKMSEYVEMSYSSSEKYAQDLIVLYKSYVGDTFLPVNLHTGTPGYVQLGYALWLALLIGVAIAIKKRNILLNYLLTCAGFLIILIYPIPYISLFIWSHFPASVIGLSNCWPMLRIYPILAALCCFIGVIALQDFYAKQISKKNRLHHWVPNTLIILAVSWSCYQAVPFTKYLQWYLFLKPAWLLPENARHRLEYTSGYHHKPILEGVYEPELYNRLLDSNEKEVENYDNRKIMEKLCLSGTHPMKNTVFGMNSLFPTQFKIQTVGIRTPLMHLRILPDIRYMLCFDSIIAQASGTFSVDGYKHETISTFSADSPSAQTILIPVFTTEHMEKDLTVTLILSASTSEFKSKDSFIKLNSFNVIEYDTRALPIQLHSLIPYHASVQNPVHFAYLETAREYVDGYVAFVNGKEYQTQISPTGRVMVPLLPGRNDVELLYKGTIPIRIAFYLSLFFWIIVVIFISHHVLLTFYHSAEDPM